MARAGEVACGRGRIRESESGMKKITRRTFLQGAAGAGMAALAGGMSVCFTREAIGLGSRTYRLVDLDEN